MKEGRIGWEPEEGIRFVDRGVNLLWRRVYTPQRPVQK